MDERVVYREETGRWYGNGEEFKTPGVTACVYLEASGALHGRAPVIPPGRRAPRREPVLP